MYTFKAENYIKSNLSLHVFKSETTTSFPSHTHDFVEIVYVAEGEGVECVDERSYAVRRGDLLFIGYGRTHAFRTDSRLVFYNVCFLPEVVAKRIENRNQAFDLLSLTALEELRGESTELGRLRFDGEDRHALEFVLREMLREYESDFSERSAVLESYMTLMLAKILRKAHAYSVPNGEEFDGVWRALSEFIDENLREKLTLSALAGKCFYNPSYFSRAFKQKFGVSLVDYIGRERARKAEELLRTTGSSVEEIAALCGFGDKASLYRAFEKHYGCTPTAYRQTIKNK